MTYTDITSHEIACKVLERDPAIMPDLSMLPEYQAKKLLATKKLLDIAEAINKVTEFTPDWSNHNQWKYYPWFRFIPGSGFSCCDYYYVNTHTRVGSRLCFKDSKIAEFFGKQFIDLHNENLNA